MSDTTTNEEVEAIRNARVRNLAARGLDLQAITQLAGLPQEETKRRLEAQGLPVLISERPNRRSKT